MPEFSFGGVKDNTGDMNGLNLNSRDSAKNSLELTYSW